MRFARGLVGMLLLTIGIPATLAGAALGLAARHADGGLTARLGVVDLQARLPDGWPPVTAWVLVALGALLVASAALLLRPPRPREVVFVVEPDQVPVLAGRLGVTSLSGMGLRPAPAPTDRQLVAVGAPAAPPGPHARPGSRPPSGPHARPGSRAPSGEPRRPGPGGPARAARLAAAHPRGHHPAGTHRDPPHPPGRPGG
jgi:hypothetical protein